MGQTNNNQAVRFVLTKSDASKLHETLTQNLAGLTTMDAASAARRDFLRLMIDSLGYAMRASGAKMSP